MNSVLRSFSFISLMVFMVIFALILGGLSFLTSIQAGAIRWGSSVDVAATAQAIRTHKRVGELQAALRLQQAAGETEVARKQQVLNTFNGVMQDQISERQSRLLEIQTQISQTRADIRAIQMEIEVLEQAIQADEAELADWRSAVERIEHDLTAVERQLQTISDQPVKRQTTDPSPILSLPSQSDDNEHQAAPDHAHEDDNDDEDHEFDD